MKRVFHLGRVMAAMTVAFGSGCATMVEDMNAQQMRHREDMRAMQEQIQRLNGRIEGLDMEVQRLATEMEAVRRLAASAGESQGRVMQGQIEEMTARMSRLEAARERDRQAIVDDLSRKMADLIKRSAPAPVPAATRSTTRRTGSASGYEHVVQAGEALSTIAAAYGVSVQAIAQENNITDASLIRVGQKLFIPER